jgi:protein-ribulosamine 3-kinase
MEELLTQTFPRLLEPLQANGRILKPSLVHGNLWEENCGTDMNTGQPKIFDAAVFYGHNELGIGMWRREVVHFGRAHIREYLRNFPPSEPKDQWDDRNRLYSVKYDFAHSIALPATHEGQREM